MAPYIIDPMHPRKIEWDLFMGFFYLAAFIMDPMVFVFEFSPLYNHGTLMVERFITVLIIVDILFNLITGYPKEDFIIAEDAEEEIEEKK